MSKRLTPNTYDPGTPDQGPHASDHGPLVLGSWIHLVLVLLGGNAYLYSRTNFKLNRAAALAEWRQLLSA